MYTSREDALPAKRINPLAEGTPGVRTYDLKPEELRRAIEVLQHDPRSVLVLVGEGGICTYDLVDAIQLAFPQVARRVYEVNLRDPQEVYWTRPFVLYQRFCGCRSLEEVRRLAEEKVGEGTMLELLRVSRIPHLVNVADASTIAEDVRAVVERRGSYNYFEEEGTKE